MLVLSTAIAGLAAGAAYALVGLSTLVTYRFVAVMNFSQTVVGAVGAFIMVDAYSAGIPLIAAVLIGMIVAGAIHGLIGLGIVAWFSNGTPGVKTAVTVIVYTGLLALGSRFFSARTARTFPAPFSGGAFEIAGVIVTWLVVVSCALAIILAALCTFVLNKTHVGLQLQALSSRPGTASLIGIPSSRIAVLVWVSTGALTALALMLVAPQFPADFAAFALLITPAFAAALVGRFRSFWLTLIGGLSLGVAQGALGSIDAVQDFRGALPFVIILAILVWGQRNKKYEELA